MHWQQNYDPFGNPFLSTLVAALPVVVLLGAIVITLFPIFWIVMTAIKPPTDWNAAPAIWIPSKPTLVNFRTLFDPEAIRNGDWNEYHLIARGNTLIHILNGHVMSVVVDEDAAHRRRDGLLGVQVHVGPPMKVEYRNFRLKALD